jgi:UDP-glucuronate 4-epimerase
MKTVLITGAAGFIGYFVAKRLLCHNYRVIGLDCLSDYYDVNLKKARLKILDENKNFSFVYGKVEDRGFLYELFKKERPSLVIHLAAQAGVRYSIENPRAFMESNLIGTFELLEAARAFSPEHMLMASTSSTYGANTEMPYQELQKADHQVSFYAATKKSNENMAHSYSHLYNLPITMFRFFTVYGPWGRPDMAAHKFAASILKNETIDVYNYGKMKRDFTYIEDLAKAIYLLINVIPKFPKDDNVLDSDSLSPVAPWRVVNIGNSNVIKLLDFILAIEEAIGIKAKCNFLPMQPGDVHATWADTSLLKKLTNFEPNTDIKVGMIEFVSWFKDFYKL